MKKKKALVWKKTPVSKKLHFICCPNNHKFRCSEHDTEEWHSQAALTETQNTQFSKPLTVITSLTPIPPRLPLHECSRAIISQEANTCMCWDPLDSITWGWYLCKEGDILLNVWIKLMHETATGKRARDILCIQLCRTWKLRDWMAITEHLEVIDFVESCALIPRCCLAPWCMFGWCSRQNETEPGFPRAYLPSAAKHPDLWVSGQSHSQHTSQLGDKHGWDHGRQAWAVTSIEGGKKFLSFPVERGETQQRDYEGVSHRVPSAWLWGQGGLWFRGWGKVTASPVIIVSHSPSYTKSSRNHSWKCLNLKCKINTRKIAATSFL